MYTGADYYTKINKMLFTDKSDILDVSTAIKVQHSIELLCKHINVHVYSYSLLHSASLWLPHVGSQA